MGSPSLLVICTLALLGGVIAQMCSSDFEGEKTDSLIDFNVMTILPGIVTVYFPNACPSIYPSKPSVVGLKVKACGLALSVDVDPSLEKAIITSQTPAMVYGQSYCGEYR